MSTLISLRHITQPTSKPARIAWPGGTIGSNKDEAIARFLEKKRERGDSLTAEQLELLKRFHSSEAAAEAERIAAQEVAASAATAAPALSTAGHKRRREQQRAHPVSESSGATRTPAPIVSKGASSKPKSVAVATHKPVKALPPPAPVAVSVDAKLSMTLDQLAALRKSPSVPKVHKKHK